MQLSVIILNWNAAADTIRCVYNVASWKRMQPAIWVVDNASTDGSAGTIARACPVVRTIHNTTNLGFAGGNNRGIAEALCAGDMPILLLNNDARMAEVDARRLMETLEADARLGFVGPLLMDAQQPDRLLAAGSKDPSLHHRSHIEQWPASDAPVQIVACVPGTAILVRAEVFRTVGLLDEAYFFASEVADLCLRARQHGYLCAIDARARAFHDLGRSSELRDTLHAYYIVRNRFLLVRKFHLRWAPALYSFWTLYSLALAAKLRWRGQQGAGRAVILGLWDGLRGRFGGQNARVLATFKREHGFHG